MRKIDDSDRVIISFTGDMAQAAFNALVRDPILPPKRNSKRRKKN